MIRLAKMPTSKERFLQSKQLLRVIQSLTFGYLGSSIQTTFIISETTPLLAFSRMSKPSSSSSFPTNAFEKALPTTRAQEIALTTATVHRSPGQASQIQTAPIRPEPEPMAPICEEYLCRNSYCEYIKLVLVSMFVIIMVLVCFAGVALHYSVLQVPVPVNFILLIGALILLAYLESLHYAVVAVEKWNMAPYVDRYPRAVKCHALVDNPEKVKKFLVGRQFFTLFVVFLIAQITAFEHMPKDFLNLPEMLSLIFIRTGLPGVFLTLTFGQLIGQIFVEEFTMQFMNFYGCEFVIRLSLFAEFIGVCNFSWLLYDVVSRIVCHKVKQVQLTMDTAAEDQQLTTIVTSDTLASPTEKIRGKQHENGGNPNLPRLSMFDYVKYFWSTGVTLGSMAIVLYGISKGAYVLPTPVVGAYIIAIVMMTVLFYLEGLMIAIVGVQYWDREIYRDYYPRAFRMHELMSQPDNVKRFIIGRQFFTVLTNFILAQVFTFPKWEASSDIHPALFYIGVKSGLPGIFIVLAFSQLLPELLAAEYPLRFQNMLGSFMIARLSLLYDAIGVGHCAWAVYYTTRSLFCQGQVTQDGKALEDSKPTIIRVHSAEVLAVSGGSVKTPTRDDIAQV